MQSPWPLYLTLSDLTDMCIASADRRPVDPPPIVDLRIYELYGDEKKDITFSHQANFFLYATLEHARPMAQGRVPVTTATLPVLTGTAVAGMAYLDRPKPAGYFIFPDLSVRHEGKYRLSFNLYEELKTPEKDADPSVSLPAPGAGRTSGPRDCVYFRLEVKSMPFHVFSAKKFPGLAESTSLSRLVNEQGCRVRIRRDVRMRRRDKVLDGYKDLGDEPATAAERYAVQQMPSDRPRSTSNASTDVTGSYGADRRPSVHDTNYYQTGAYQHPQPPPQSASSYTSHLSFGGSNTSHYQTPTMPTVYQMPSAPYPYAQHHHTRQLSGPSVYGYQTQPPQQATYMPPYVDERSYPDSRRSSGGYSIGRSQASADPYQHSRPAIQPSTSSSHIRSLTPINTAPTNTGIPSLPPIKALVHESPLDHTTSEPKSSTSTVPPGPHNPFSTVSYPPSSYHASSPAIPQNGNSVAASQTKRAYGDVFDASHISQPMHSGMRPSSGIQAQDLPHIETADGEYSAYDNGDDMGVPLVYKRADGSRRAKKCPSPRDRSTRAAYALDPTA